VKPRLISLCTGYGGLEMGLRLAGIDFELAAVADPDPAASTVLAHHHPDVPNLGDITAVNWTTNGPVAAVDWSSLGPVDILTAGYPCQPFSLAGHRKGTEDDRHIWPAVAYAVRVLRPGLVLLENVPGHLSLGFGRVLADLAGLGYVGSWRCVRADDIGAAHRRNRIFIAAWPADTAGQGLETWRQGRAGGGAASHADGAAFGAQPLSLTGSGGTAVAGDPGEGDGGLTLLPTPRASARENRQTKRTPSQIAGEHGLSLAAEICSLLPSPRATDGTHGGPNQRGSSGGLMLPSAVQPWHFGKYQAATDRWASVLGRPAPEPTEPNGADAVRLAAPFTEWLMGLPAGWVTDLVDRNDALRLLGNGVVPLQAAAAIRELVAA